MKLTTEQQAAVDSINRWLKDDDQWMFYMGGYAGTGKTTLLHHFINGLSVMPTCLAPTGKAASVLQSKLSEAEVCTIHSALYKPVMQDTEQLEALLELLAMDKADPGLNHYIPEVEESIKQEKLRLSKQELRFSDNENRAILPGSLVIVDEASMVTNRMFDDLSKLEAKVLFVGDPGQLPPVKDAGYFTYTKPDAMLTSVQRQALDNPIIELSMKIRTGAPVPDRIDNDHIFKDSKTKYPLNNLPNVDQILTGRNDVRRKINRMVRKFMGRESNMPEMGEKLICLKNDYKFGGWWTNGVQCASTSDAIVNHKLDWEMDVLYEGRPMNKVPFYGYPFQVHYDSTAEQEPWQSRRGLIELDYGYAITVHKSQGSEWDKVVLVDDEMMMSDVNFRKRWLYTAVTRAKGHLTWLTQQ